MVTVTAGLVENAVDQVVTYLQANLNAWIDATNVYMTAQGAARPAISHVANFYVSEQPTFPEPPWVAVMADASFIQLEDGGVIHNTRHVMTVLVGESDGDNDTLKRKLYRQVLAVVQCLNAGQTSPAPLSAPLVPFWQHPYAVYSPIYVKDTSLFADAHLAFELLLEE